jgi:hypothetical protein
MRATREPASLPEFHKGMFAMAFSVTNLDRLVPIQGVCYSPAPSDDTPAPPQRFFDTDFTNSAFPLLWGGATKDGVTGRDDLGTLAAAGVNFLHLYNWSVPPAPGSAPGQYQRNHLPFLSAAKAAGIRVMVPVSNYFMGEIANGNGDTVKADIQAMVAEVYDGHTTLPDSAAMWSISNEFDLATTFSADDVATAMLYLTEAETALGIPADDVLPVCAPVSFAAAGGLPPGIQAMQTLKAAVAANTGLPSDFWTRRMVGALNSFNSGDYLATYISTTFPEYFADLPFFLSEMGINTDPSRNEAQQAGFVADQLAHTGASGNFLGRCVFQFLNQTAMKTGTEATFGMTKFDNGTTPPPTGTIPAGYVPGGGETYNVDVLKKKPLFDKVSAAFTG